VKILKAFPEVKVETLFSLDFLPVICEFVNVSSAVSEEEFGYITIKVLVSLIVVG
jgi:hypothetical protein